MASLSRNDVSLNIAGGTDEHYDQICALSQKMINENFEILFKQREKDLPDVKYTDSQAKAKISCVLLPPRLRLKIGSSDMPEYYFELRIEKGSVQFDDGRFQNISGFVIAVRAMLETQEISPNNNHDDDQAKEIAPYWGEVKKNFNVKKIEPLLKAGDYSVERLFTNITHSDWLSPDLDWSQLPNPKDPSKRISFRDWKAMTDSKSTLMSGAVCDVFSHWATDRDHEALWTLGLQVKVPDTTDETNLATYLPLAVRLQNYPYVGPDEEYSKLKALGPAALYGRDYNCLVFCEVVETRIAAEQTAPKILPTGSRLAYNGNLADAQTPGTYVLDHRTYFFDRILKDLRQLCVAINVIPLKPEIGVDQNKNQYFRSGISVGTNPPDRETVYPGVANQDANDPDFAFKYMASGKYVWTKRLAAPGSGQDTRTFTDCLYAPIYRKWDIHSTQTVTVSWKPATNKITVTGSTAYYHWEGFSTKHDRWAWNGKGNDPFYYGLITINVTWSFDIVLEGAKEGQEGAGLQPKLERLQGGLPTDLKIKGEKEWVRDDTMERLSADIQKNMIKALEHITDSIKKGFENAGKLTYPGTRTLKFESPQLNNYGDIMTTISYQPLGPDLVTLIPPVKVDIPDFEPFENAPQTSDAMVFKPMGHLVWDIKFPYYDSRTKRARIVLKATNASTKEKFAFDSVQLAIQKNSGEGQTSLFTDRSNWELPAEIEAKKQELENQRRKKLEEERREQVAVAKEAFESSKATSLKEQNQKIQDIEKIHFERDAKLTETIHAYKQEKDRIEEAKKVEKQAMKKVDAAPKPDGIPEPLVAPKPDEPSKPEETPQLDETLKAEEAPKPDETSKLRETPTPKGTLEPEATPELDGTVKAEEASTLNKSPTPDKGLMLGEAIKPREALKPEETTKLNGIPVSKETPKLDESSKSDETLEAGQAGEPEESLKAESAALEEIEKAAKDAEAAFFEVHRQLNEAKTKVAELQAQTFDETSVIFKEPETPDPALQPVEENAEIYGLSQTNINETLMIKVEVVGSTLYFSVKSKPKGFLKKKSGRFYMDPGSYFTIQLEGTVGNPGKYVAQIQEVWNSTNPSDDYASGQFSDVFWKFTLLEGGSAFADSVSHSEADSIRGITQP